MDSNGSNPHKTSTVRSFVISMELLPFFAFWHFLRFSFLSSLFYLAIYLLSFLTFSFVFSSLFIPCLSLPNFLYILPIVSPNPIKLSANSSI